MHNVSQKDHGAQLLKCIAKSLFLLYIIKQHVNVLILQTGHGFSRK